MPYPDVQQYAYRDYGNRVGFWRMLEVLDAYRIKCCASLNMAVLEHYPEVAEAMVQRDWDFMSHGTYNTIYLYTYPEAQERDFYRDCIEMLQRHTGKRLKGMLGPAITGTERTPDLMAEAGLIYHTDWMHDDQPAPIHVIADKLVSVPYSIELNDVPVFRQHFEGEYFVRKGFDRMYRDGAQTSRLLVLNLHPWFIGQPFRTGHLDGALGEMVRRQGVWAATGAEITEWYRQHPPAA
jgi:allantoinase